MDEAAPPKRVKLCEEGAVPVAAVREKALELVELLPEEYTRPVILTAFHAVRIPKALGSVFLKLLQTHAPLGADFLHLKRARAPPKTSTPGDTGILEVLICPAESELAQEVVDFLEAKGCTRHEIEVPKYGALTREQLAEYSQHWPLTYRKPSFEPLEISVALGAKYARYLERAAEVGAGRCGCVIIDGQGCELAAAADDSSTEKKPLAHAIMLAIEQVASKRAQVTEAATQPSGEEEYLCQDYEVITTHEPCIMCAMALVHSRVRLVAYRYADSDFGGLGGKISMHTCASLNHQFRVLLWRESE